jgi:hypothetical protein
MLKVSPRGKLEGLRELSAQEGRALREGFGRWHESRARPAGAAVVRTHQHTGPGVWFFVRLPGLVAAPDPGASFGIAYPAAPYAAVARP